MCCFAPLILLPRWWETLLAAPLSWSLTLGLAWSVAVVITIMMFNYWLRTLSWEQYIPRIFFSLLLFNWLFSFHFPIFFSLLRRKTHHFFSHPYVPTYLMWEMNYIFKYLFFYFIIGKKSTCGFITSLKVWYISPLVTYAYA